MAINGSLGEVSPSAGLMPLSAGLSCLEDPSLLHRVCMYMYMYINGHFSLPPFQW